MSIITRLAVKIEYFARHYNPWTKVYACARSLLAFGTLITLIFNDSGILFRPTAQFSQAPACIGIAKVSIFCLFNDNLELARFICILLLLIVLTGFYPRITALFHWWVSFSVITTMTIVDGGDQIASVLTLLLIPIAITDNRKNHWNDQPVSNSIYSRILVYSTICVIRLQIAILYFHSSVSKFNVEEWVDGTAVYYWFLDPMFGIPYEKRTILVNMLSNGIFVAALTWGTLILELLIATTLFLPPNHRMRRLLLPVGLLFHIGILLIHGLVSFFFSMAASLILLLIPATSTSLSNYRKSKHSKIDTDPPKIEAV